MVCRSRPSAPHCLTTTATAPLACHRTCCKHSAISLGHTLTSARMRRAVSSITLTGQRQIARSWKCSPAIRFTFKSLLVTGGSFSLQGYRRVDTLVHRQRLLLTLLTPRGTRVYRLRWIAYLLNRRVDTPVHRQRPLLTSHTTRHKSVPPPLDRLLTQQEGGHSCPPTAPTADLSHHAAQECTASAGSLTYSTGGWTLLSTDSTYC